jgi:hypothetical protein
MKNLPFLAIVSLLLLISFGVSGCMPAVRLTPPELEKAPTRIGSVAIGEINDLRPPASGGQDFGTIGEVRGGFGGFSPLRTEEGREIDVAVREALRNALAHTGYYVLDPALPGDVPFLEVDVLEFWLESRKGRHIETLLIVKLVDPDSRASVVQRKITISRDLAVPGRHGSLPETFDRVMRDLQQEFASFMRSEPFRVAVRRN